LAADLLDAEFALALDARVSTIMYGLTKDAGKRECVKRLIQDRFPRQSSPMHVMQQVDQTYLLQRRSKQEKPPPYEGNCDSLDCQKLNQKRCPLVRTLSCCRKNRKAENFCSQNSNAPRKLLILALEC
jgi:hypothetical protein